MNRKGISSFCRQIFVIAISIVSVYGIQNILKLDAISENYNVLSNSICGVGIFIVLIYMYNVALDKINDKKLFLLSAVVSIFYSSTIYFGKNILVFDLSKIEKFKSWIIVTSLMPVFTVVIYLLIARISKNYFLAFEDKRNTKFSRKKVFLFSWALIFIAWLPILFATYPGIYSYDSIYQIFYYQSEHIDLQHPLVHTYLLGFCVVNIGKLLGSYQLGLLIYSLVQMVVLSSAFAIIILYMYEKKLSAKLISFWVLLFMFLPVNPIMALSTTKDVIYAATFVYVIYVDLKMVTDEKFGIFRWNLIFVIVNFINIIFRSQGIYVFIASAIVGLAILKGDRVRLLLSVLVTILLFVIYSGPVTTLAGGVANANLKYREMMSVPVVQLSRVAVIKGDSLGKDLKRIKEYIPNYSAYPSNEAISDSMKNTFNVPKFRKNPAGFFKLWWNVGIKNKRAYVDAFLRLTIGLWYPDMEYRDFQAYHPYWYYKSYTAEEMGNNWLIVNQSPVKGFNWLNKLYLKISNGEYQKIPVVSILFSSGILIWLLVLYGIVVIYEKRYRLLYPMALVLCLYLTLLLGPVVLYRYIYPIAVTIPLLFASLFNKKQELDMQSGIV